MTTGVAALPLHDQFAIVACVRAFDEFTPDNDPYSEHDFGSFDQAGEHIFWKIDCYAVDDMNVGSEAPADPAQTTRVLTMMLAHEY